MRMKFLAFVITGALTLVGAVGALAQDATPEAENLFADLGLPELTVTATNEGFELSESEVEAGRYLVHFVNESDNPDVAAGFVGAKFADGTTVGQWQ